MVNQAFWGAFKGKSVLVTGHTGFKGAWFSEWLLALGSTVTGFALPPPTNPSLFDQLKLEGRLRHVRGDVRDEAAVKRVIEESMPDFIFHLAAQPLVRLSYRQPVETFAANVMGTVNLLEAVRQAARPCVVVAITTDKCYENKEWLHSYREGDPLGGSDPYSSSKAAAELVIAAYRRSFFSDASSGVYLASARAGNVMGGGDWAEDRIIPDCVRALQSGRPIQVRNRWATRPWQHVLEPLSGYLSLGAALSGAMPLRRPQSRRSDLTSGFNFGPSVSSNRSVLDVVCEVFRHWPGEWVDQSDPEAVHEAHLLSLSSDKACHLLGWRPVWDFEETLAKTMRWYRQASTETRPEGLRELTLQQIEDYARIASARGVPWAGGPEI